MAANDLKGRTSCPAAGHRLGGRLAALHINGSPATVQQLREVGESLVDIHGQHAHQSLCGPMPSARCPMATLAKVGPGLRDCRLPGLARGGEPLATAVTWRGSDASAKAIGMAIARARGFGLYPGGNGGALGVQNTLPRAFGLKAGDFALAVLADKAIACVNRLDSVAGRLAESG